MCTWVQHEFPSTFKRQACTSAACRSAISQDTLRELWLGGQHGRLCPWEQAKALGLRQASREIHGGKVNLPWIPLRSLPSLLGPERPGTKVQGCDQRGQNLQHWRSRGRWPLQKEAGRRDPAAAWAAVVGGHLSMPGQQYLAEARRPWLAATARRHAPKPHSRGRGQRPPGDAGRPAGGHGGMPAPRPLL